MNSVFLFIITSIVIGFIFVLIQFVFYKYEKGIYVADSIGAEALSQNFYVSLMPIAERAKHADQRHRLSIFDKWLFWRAIRKFPEVSFCLKKRGEISIQEDWMAWHKIITPQQASVCIYHISTALLKPEKIQIWFEKQGFNTSIHTTGNGNFFVSGIFNNSNEKSLPFGVYSTYKTNYILQKAIKTDLSLQIMYNNGKFKLYKLTLLSSK